MAQFKLPLSGDVTQWINPTTWFLSGNQVTINMGDSSDPGVETDMLDKVGTYGRQLGQITDALVVLLRHLPDPAKLSQDETDALVAFEKMARKIAKVKTAHGLDAVTPAKGPRRFGNPPPTPA